MKSILIILFIILFVVKLSNAGCTVTNCDNNPDYEKQCLKATCSRTGVCVTSPINCPDDPPCLEGVCVTGVGCQLQTRNCSNAKFCDYDFKCNATTSGCQHSTIPGCVECKHIGCTTTDQCNVQVCSEDGTSCVNQPKDCNDNNACTNDFCQSPDGVCNHPMIPGCVNCPELGIGCTTTDRCFPQLCPTNGSRVCINSTKNCDDGDYCTIDTCSNGTCSNQPIENCINCRYTACITTDQCNKQICSDDGRSCIDQPKDCDNGNICDVNTCISPDGTCSSTPKDCDDGDDCTTDSCSPNNGTCLHETIPNCVDCQNMGCITTDQCFPKICIGGTSCTNTTKTCDDSKFCTTDLCISPNGTCINTPIQNCIECTGVGCITTNQCFPQLCPTDGSQQCINSTKDCDDDNGCTNDFCNPDDGTCYHVMIPGCLNCNGTGCITADRCFPKVCVGSECGNTTKSCEDGNGCSINECTSPGGMCSNVPIPDCVNCNGTGCITTNPCRPKICSMDGNSCVETIKDCDDSDDDDFCTIGTCNEESGTCVTMRIPNCINCKSIGCITTDNCFPKICSPKGDSCIVVPKSCDDGLTCTIDSCISPEGTCVHSKVRSANCTECEQTGCKTTDFCYPNICTPDGCKIFPVNCTDNDKCTQDSCINGACLNFPIPDCNVIPTTIGGHYTESGTGNVDLCLRKKCRKGFECQVINNRAECVPNKFQCLDCRDLNCGKNRGLTCIMIENPIYKSKDRHGGCEDKECCQFTPTCTKKKL